MTLSAAAQAFDAIAPAFDARYGAWRSVAAQRALVRSIFADAVPLGTRVLEIGGGTGEDAVWLAHQGYPVHLTDASPAMIDVARNKLANEPLATAEVVAAEDYDDWSQRRERSSGRFGAALSNFAALNCVIDLAPFARGLARVLQPGAPAMLVLFGPLPPGEMIVQLAHRSPRAALRRLRRDAAPARLGGHDFTIQYHRPADVRRALHPWFDPVARHGIGVFVPPSAAEPWISEHPRLLNALASLDRIAARPLALLGDHVLYHFTRNNTPCDDD